MAATIEIIRAGPLVTVQDHGRFGRFGDGISASGPMDCAAFSAAGQMLDTPATSGLEITMAGIAFKYLGSKTRAACSGGTFALTVNGEARDWNSAQNLSSGDLVEIKPGPAGNYGYIRFDAEIDVPKVLGSRATNLIVRLGGYEGRALVAGDKLNLIPAESGEAQMAEKHKEEAGPIRFIWGIHADHFESDVRTRFQQSSFRISTRLDRMGVRLTDEHGVFANARVLSLVSDAIVPGDIQILGDGTPIVLMRDHQPTGGYPRIGTVISVDLDRFAQLRPNCEVHFAPITVEHAHLLLQQAGRAR